MTTCSIIQKEAEGLTMMKWCVQDNTAKFGRADISSLMVFHSVIFLSDLLWCRSCCFSRNVYKRNAFIFFYWFYFLSLLNKIILKHPLWLGGSMLLRSLMSPERKKKEEEERKESSSIRNSTVSSTLFLFSEVWEEPILHKNHKIFTT